MEVQKKARQVRTDSTKISQAVEQLVQLSLQARAGGLSQAQRAELQDVVYNL